MALKTRAQHSAEYPNLYEFLGSPAELCDSELPTLRQCFRYGLLLKERSVNKMHVRPMCCEILSAVQIVWKRANSKIKLVTEKYATDKLVKLWKEAGIFSNNKKGKEAAISDFRGKLDKLFDLAKYKCTIYACKEYSCLGCKNQAHVDCKCPKEDKIPLKELSFMKSQRDKVGNKGTMQIGPMDFVETKRQKRSLLREENRANPKRAKANIDEPPSTSSSIYDSDKNDPENYSDDQDSDVSIGLSFTQDNTNRNFLNVSKISTAAIRYDVSNRATAAISTATIAALKDDGFLKNDVEIIIDHNKIKRCKGKVMKEQQIAKKISLEKSNIQGILFDGRKDDTIFLRRSEDGKLHHFEMKEEHISICSEPGGEYQWHFTVDSGDRDESEKGAEQIASLIYECINDNGIKDSLLAIGGDSTNVNTGWKGGAIQFLENKMGRKLIWLICALHTNELPLRHLMIKLDGKTTSGNKFSGPIGKLITSNIMLLKVKESIPKVGVEICLIELDEHVIKSLSQDQKYLYEITKAIQSGIFPPHMKDRAIGLHSHARWLNLANRLCRVWCSEHKIIQNNTKKLKLLVEFVVGVYSPMWFEIKVKHKWTYGPHHILKQLQLVRLQKQKVQDIVMKYLHSSAWNAHSENLLQTLLCSSESEDRKFAIETILNLRGEESFGDTSLRVRKNPTLNIDAKKLVELIEWSSDVHEPLLTCSMSKENLLELETVPMEVMDFPVHAQSIERCVKEVTRASAIVYGEDRRDGYIKATLAHRQILPTNQSKKDLKKIFE